MDIDFCAVTCTDDAARIVVASVELVDVVTVDSFHARLRALVDHGIRRMTLELGAVELLSSCAISVIVDIDRALREHGGQLVLTGMRTSCLEVFAFMNLDRILSIETRAA